MRPVTGAKLTKLLRLLAMLLMLTAATSAGSAGRITPAIPPETAAPIALLVDMSSGQTLFQRDIDRRFVPASMTKLMTLYVAFELLDQKKLTPGQIFTVRPATFAEWHNKGSRMFLPADAHVTVDELLTGIASVSANDGAIVLAEGAVGSVGKWVKLMNMQARMLGMQNTHYGTPNGWMDEGGTYTTARDLSKLARAIIRRHPAEYGRYFGRKGYTYNGITQANHDPITGAVPGADGLKTGFTNEAGYGFTGSAIRDGRRLIMVVAACETGAMRKQAARELMEWGFDVFATRHLFAQGQHVGNAKVQDGTARSLDLLAPGTINATFPAGQQHHISLTINYEGPLQAPIAKGEEVAELEIKVAGLPPSRVPLIAANSIRQAGPLQRMLNGVRGLL